MGVRPRARRVAVGLSDTPGPLVAAVLPGSAAVCAGISRADLIVAVDGRPARCTAVLDSDTFDLRADPLRGDERITVQLRS